jgi:hypothetical protein
VLQVTDLGAFDPAAWVEDLISPSPDDSSQPVPTGTLRDRLLAARGRTMTEQAYTPPAHVPTAPAPSSALAPPSSLAPSTAPRGKTATYLLVGAGVLAVGGLAIWLLR